MKKKLVSAILAMTMVAGLIAGCGGNDQGSNDKPAGNTPSTEATGNNDSTPDGGNEEVYHMVMEIVNFGFDDPDIQMVQDEVNKRTVPEIGVEVEFLTVPIMEMGTKLGLMISSGEQMDLVCTGLITSPQRLAAEGSLLPMTDIVNNSAILSKACEGVVDACMYDGEIYSVPGVTAAGIEVCFYYDKALAQQYNIQIPERISTPAEWDAFFSQVKASGMEQYPISLGDGMKAELASTGYAFDCLGDKSLCANGVIMPGEPDKVVNYYATDLYKEKCKMHKEWFEKGYCVPDSISNGYSMTDSMKQGTVFGIIANRGSGQNEGVIGRQTGKDLGYIPVGDVVIQSANVTAISYGISAACEKPEKVVKFLEMLYGDKDMENLMNFGIEGVHYTTTEGSNVIGYPEGVDASNCGYGNFLGIPCDNSVIYVREPLTDEFTNDMNRYKYSTETASPYLGYTFNTDAVSTELSAVSAVINKYAPALECGVVNPDEKIPEFLKELEKAGMDAIVAENQKQLDAWLATQK